MFPGSLVLKVAHDQRVVERHGTGALAGADIIQRINTAGGVLHGSCDRAGSLRSVGYSADYVFRRKDR